MPPLDPSTINLCVIISAGGASTRFAAAGGVRSKLDEDLGGKPVLQRCVELFTKHDAVRSIIVAGPGEPAAFAEFKEQHGDRLSLMGAKLVPGGITYRWESVKNALAHVPADATHVAVHDAARPCVTLELVDRVINAAARFSAAIPAVDVADTVKRLSTREEVITEDDPAAAILGLSPASGPKARFVGETIPRERLVQVQTPQIFEAALLQKAYAQPDLSSTDDAGLVERLGHPVAVVDGEARNIKITLPSDVTLARLILNVAPPAQREAHKRF